MLKLQEKLVYSIISKYANQNNKEDLFQVGMMGATIAYQKYDKSLGIKYSTFAYKYILQSMNLAYVPGTQSTMWKVKIKVIYKI